MTANSRIDDLRRRVQQDPASIAFAQLAEECRRAGAHQEAVDTCRAGLAVHPGYLSARVTLGRALIELGRVDEAEGELSRVLESAPENLAAIRGLAEIHHRRGNLTAALVQYRAALALARNDPDLEETIADLSRQVEPPKPPPTGGLTLEHMKAELLKHTPPAKASAAPAALNANPPVPPPIAVEPLAPAPPPAEPPVVATATTESTGIESIESPEGPVDSTPRAAANDQAMRTVAALEEWLTAIHGSRERRTS
jgi:tetratricopeptide (TPR) repeat protein